MKKENKVFSDNLSNLIKRSGKDQKEIAESIGVSPAALNMWCNGVTYPRAPKVQALAAYFHVTVSDLVDEHKEGFDVGLDLGNGYFVFMEAMNHASARNQLKDLLECVNKLNDDGMDKILERAQELEQMPKYVKEEYK